MKRRTQEQRAEATKLSEDGRQIDAGRFATAEEVQEARTAAIALLRAIHPFNLPRAAEIVASTDRSALAIAFLPYVAHDLFMRDRQSRVARLRRQKSLRQAIRNAGISRYREIKEKAPELHTRGSKRQLTEAISKVNRERKKLP